MNLVYGYGTSNNGQIQSVDSYNASGVLDPAKSVSYQYDEWARLKQAETGNLTSPDTFRIAWTYDRYGNRLSQSSTGGTLSVTNTTVTVAAATNRITTSGFTYDSAGNLTNDGVHTYVYDGENRIKTLDGASANATYDAAGLRVKKGSTVYIFAGSKVIAEYASGTAATSPSKEYVYSGSQLLVTKTSSTTTYAYNDHLSARMERDLTGASVRSFGHLPFGDAWYESGTASKWKFTSYERDTDSATDYAIFRQSSTRLGRFLQVDPMTGYVVNPQSFNRYAYVRGDPINLEDPLGLCGGADLWNPSTNTVTGFYPCVPGPGGGGGSGPGGPAPLEDADGGGGGATDESTRVCDHLSGTANSQILQVTPGVQMRLQYDANEGLVAASVQLTGDEPIRRGSTTIPANTFLGYRMNNDGSISVGVSNPIEYRWGLTGAYLSSATFNNGEFTEVRGALAFAQIPFGSRTGTSSILQLYANDSAAAMALGNILQNLATQLNRLVACSTINSSVGSSGAH